MVVFLIFLCNICVWVFLFGSSIVVGPHCQQGHTLSHAHHFSSSISTELLLFLSVRIQITADTVQHGMAHDSLIFPYVLPIPNPQIHFPIQKICHSLRKNPDGARSHTNLVPKKGKIEKEYLSIMWSMSSSAFICIYINWDVFRFFKVNPSRVGRGSDLRKINPFEPCPEYDFFPLNTVVILYNYNELGRVNAGGFGSKSTSKWDGSLNC